MGNPKSRRRAQRGKIHRRSPGAAPSEHSEQSTFFAHVREYLPHVRRLVFKIANDAARFGDTAAKLVAEGMEKGTSDWFAAIPRAGFHGLFCEMKRTSGGEVSPDQDEALRLFSAMGYATVRADGWREAWSALLAYLELPT